MPDIAHATAVKPGLMAEMHGAYIASISLKR